MDDPKAIKGNAMIDCGEDMIAKGAKDYIIAWASHDGSFLFSASNRTWALGAVHRLLAGLEEQERIDQRERNAK